MADNQKQWRGPASSLGGVVWFIGWLFTIGFLGLNWWQIIVGVIIWPYFLGAALR